MIVLKNVTSGYQDFPVLQDISLQIESGEFCALLGPNGAGKSTLLYTIMGYLKPFPELYGQIQTWFLEAQKPVVLPTRSVLRLLSPCRIWK